MRLAGDPIFAEEQVETNGSGDERRNRIVTPVI